MIPLRMLLDDYYEFDERNFCLVGRRYRKRYGLGDKVRIRVERANLERRQLDFALVDDGNGPVAEPTFREHLATEKKNNKKAKKNKRGVRGKAKRFQK